jgi:hypothetical protein
VTTDVEESARAIGTEIGLDVSYLTDEDERRFDPITIATGAGLVLLGWFLDGVRDTLQEEVTGAGSALTARLIAGFKRLFGKDEAPSPDEVAATAAEARAAAGDRSPPEVASAVDSTTQGIVEYLLDQGMPEAKATRIADRVRDEAARQLNTPTG